MISKFIIIIMLAFSSVFAGNLKNAVNTPAELVDQYKEGIKSSVISMLENSLDQNSSIIVKNNFVNKINNYNTKEFIELIKNKTIVNGDTKVTVLYEDGDNASMKLEDISGKIKYLSYISCLKTGESWKIVNIVITINKI